MHLSDRPGQIHNAVPLAAVPTHYVGTTGSPFLAHYLGAVLRHTPAGGRTLEIGGGSGYGAVWLSLRGVCAEGLDRSPVIVERCRQVNQVLGGSASFSCADLFGLYGSDLLNGAGLYGPDAPRYDVIHHQGVLEHFAVPAVRAALAQQVALARRVVFSVPSVHYPFDPESGDERLLPLEEWERVLAPFDVEDLRYYGDPRLGAQEQILCVLRGQRADDRLLALMRPGEHPYTGGVSAIVHTRNEAGRIAECLQTLVGWADEIIVCDMESEDETVAIAARFTDQIVRHPRIENFDRARNVSAMRASREWVFYLDADERVPERLGQQLRAISRSGTTEFDALLPPFRHHFAGHWMRSMYPGYTAPRFLRNGRFVFNARLHAGAVVDGRVVAFPADDPELALTHYSYDSLSHYLDKLNRYTDGESLNMWRDGQAFHWQNAVAHFTHDFKDYYDNSRLGKDGVHGFLYSFQSAFYRFFQHAKLYERRFRDGQLTEWEKAVPASLEEVLEYALRVCRQKPRPPVPQVRLSPEEGAAQVVWTGPVLDRSGYGDESRNLLLALSGCSGGKVAAQVLPWGEEASLSEADALRLADLAQTPAAPGFAQVVHTFGSHLERHPAAGAVIGRTVFETDRLPADWVAACGRMDRVWVPSEFNRRTFADAGVDPARISVVPECLDAARYASLPTRADVAIHDDLPPVVREIASSGAFIFLSVFDWTRHKGWDALLRAFLTGFGLGEDARLVLKVWSTNGYTDGQIREQAREFARAELGIDLDADGRVLFLHDYLAEDDLRALYAACDAYVLPSRGEGWGRPYMEAMACGLPTVGTRWGGNTAFMDDGNSFLVDCALADVPEAGWREIPTYKGHRWAEPDGAHLKAILRQIFENREQARAVGVRARREVLASFSREAVGPLIAAELERAIRESGVRASDESRVQASDARGTQVPARVRWEGATFRHHSLAHVNREVCLGLLEAGVDLSLVPTEPDDFAPEQDERLLPLAARRFAPLAGAADVHVRHGFPPRFGRPDEGRFVLVQPWEYGYLPRDWAARVNEQVSEVWCYSSYVMDVYRDSGVPEDKLKLVPLGVDADLFQPGALPYVFTDEPGAARLGGGRPFLFLYVGGTVHRKGFDVLLDAYLKAFSAADDVALVVKDTGTATVYRDHNHRERLLGLAADPAAPRVVYLEREMPARELAGLYGRADCLVAPYRGEGFCLPALEAMACGVPALVTAGGPTDDFVDESVGWRVPAARAPFGEGRIGEWECAGPTWVFEVSPDELARLMREVRAQPQVCRARGEAAARRVREGWTWGHCVARVRERLDALRETSAPAPPTLEVAAPGPADERFQGKTETNGLRPAAGYPVLGGPRRPTISLCMIVRDEERVLGDCLASVRPWVDEIVVVDTGSADRTAEIAAGYGAKVVHIPWPESFSAARNESLRHATGDWILWMDADDTLPPECGAGLRDAVMLAEERVAGLIMQVRIPPPPGELGQTVVDHVKLFRNGLGLRFEGRIHEQILEPIHRMGGEVRRTGLHVVHSGYDYSPAGQARKRARDLRLLELDLAERPDHPFVLFNIGMTAFHTRDFPRAVSALERCLSVSRPQESTVRKVYAMLAGCALEGRDLLGARRWIEQGLALYPRDPELLFRGGTVYKEIGSLGRAEECYLALLGERETGHIDSLDETLTGFKAHHNLAMVYQERGDPEAAARHFREALRLEPGFALAAVGLEAVLRQRPAEQFVSA